ncbi:hypothetical protein CC2G_001750 [Coprinopsis cinerea AmutBmut pab1-1]|nr:hypothetical protein CC2G_001750 [Coprinopsis cinerea AmutBmut pab1-1]
MGLEEDYPLYLSISRTVKLAAIQTNAIAAKSFRSLPADKLAAIYRKVRDTHPYMDRRRFPGDWATAELLKQYLKNHRKYERRRGRWSPSGSGISSLPNIDEH